MELRTAEKEISDKRGSCLIIARKRIPVHTWYISLMKYTRDILVPEQIINKVDEFDKQFIERFGSLKCGELRGRLNNKCNDYVGAAAYMAATI